MAKTKNKEPEILSTKKYTIEWVSYKDGSAKSGRKNEGFTSLELLGMLERVQMEILQQMAGQIKPNVTERTVIKNKH
jgi:hypothetical protein